VGSSTDGVLLWQVACEFVAASEGVLQHAQGLHLSHGVSFWDAMILASCGSNRATSYRR
jgi:predicted nucleic acid-binding protein